MAIESAGNASPGANGEKVASEHVEQAAISGTISPSPEDWPQSKPELNRQMVLAFIVSH